MLLRSYQRHMAILAHFQQADGLWRNVIDYRGAYPELSATAMIGFAMLRGVERGWLDKARYRAVVERAWRAILERTGPQGRLIDVCESTARMSSLEEYLHVPRSSVRIRGRRHDHAVRHRAGWS